LFFFLNGTGESRKSIAGEKNDNRNNDIPDNRRSIEDYGRLHAWTEKRDREQCFAHNDLPPDHEHSLTKRYCAAGTIVTII